MHGWRELHVQEYIKKHVQIGNLDPVKFCEHFKFTTEAEAARIYQEELKNLADTKFKRFSAERKLSLTVLVERLRAEQAASNLAWDAYWALLSVTRSIRVDAARRQAFHTADLVAEEQAEGRNKRRRTELGLDAAGKRRRVQCSGSPTPGYLSEDDQEQEDDNEQDYAEVDDESVPDAPPLLLLAPSRRYIDSVEKAYREFIDGGKCQNPLWRRIVDLLPTRIGEQTGFGPSAYLETEELAALQADLDKKLNSLYPVRNWFASGGRFNGLVMLAPGALDQLRNSATVPHACSRRRPSLALPEMQPADWAAVCASGNEDVGYILELLRRSTEAADAFLGRTKSSERDLDVLFHDTAFSCFRPFVTAHFGEIESRASRDRRIRGAQTAGVSAAKVRGQFVDWLWVDDTEAMDSAWGVEVAAGANVGAIRGPGLKLINDRTHELPAASAATNVLVSFRNAGQVVHMANNITIEALTAAASVAAVTTYLPTPVRGAGSLPHEFHVKTELWADVLSMAIKVPDAGFVPLWETTHQVLRCF
ncbi:hypothetical protein HDU86_004981 [Geranomyces michiganensis]|nr:hypothetical protein HDU86_004981 [Geranomyces michiganensis]